MGPPGFGRGPESSPLRAHVGRQGRPPVRGHCDSRRRRGPLRHRRGARGRRRGPLGVGGASVGVAGEVSKNAPQLSLCVLFHLSRGWWKTASGRRRRRGGGPAAAASEVGSTAAAMRSGGAGTRRRRRGRFRQVPLLGAENRGRIGQGTLREGFRRTRPLRAKLGRNQCRRVCIERESLPELIRID